MTKKKIEQEQKERAERNYLELMEHFRKEEIVDEDRYNEAVRKYNEAKGDEELG